MYNNPMTHTNTLRCLTLLALVMPTMTLAYTSPEEVLSSGNNAQYFNPPPTARDALATQQAQQSSDAAVRNAAQAAILPSSAVSSTPTDAAHGAAPTDQSALLQQLMNALGQKSSVSTADQRALDRIHQQQYDAQVQADAMMIVAQNGGMLHSGAPLSQSGPGTVVSLLVLMLAGVWTFWKARKMEKTQ